MVLRRAFSKLFCGSLGLFLFSQAVWARAFAEAWPASAAAAPHCPAYSLKSENGGNPGNLADNNNAQVLTWKAAQQNQFLARAHVQGPIVRVDPDRNGHQHFAIQIGADDSDTVEIIYNKEFGSLRTPAVGDPVEACGDYITSVAPTPGPDGEVYPASPDGGIVHWVHMAPSHSGHNSGYLMVNGVLTGQQGPN